MPKILEEKTTETPDTLKPYIFHGLDLDWSDSDDEATGDCPFCGREGKFTVNVTTGQYRCFICAEGTKKGGGNSHVFIRHLYDISRQLKTDYSQLAADRGLLESTLQAWGVVKSATTGHWLIPGYGVDGKLNQLYRYGKVKDRKALLPTPNHGHQIHLPPDFDPKRPLAYICEGPWDGMALWEVMSQTKTQKDGSFALTASQENSILSDANVYAIPSIGAVGEPFEKWLPLFTNKVVMLMYDNDYPKTNEKTGKESLPAGYAGMKRSAGLLGGYKEPPESVQWLKWGNQGYDSALDDGTDVRDWLTGNEPMQRIDQLGLMMNKLHTVPQDWLELGGHTKSKTHKHNKVDIDCLPCDNYKTLINAWRKAMKWTPGLDHGLAAMLACIASTAEIGDQLWIKIIGPPSCGKSTLCDGISAARKYVLSKSTIRGFFSGYKSDEDGEEDNSLAAKADNMTLVNKDGDALLQAPNLGQILSEGRDLYDGKSGTDYRNKMGRDYDGHRMTWILCGTESLRTIDNSELGERFLDCVVMEKIDPELEDEVLWRVANRENNNLGGGKDGNSSRHDKDKVHAMALTGGYVGYLRENAHDLLSGVDFPQQNLRRCIHLAKFVAYMRARPSYRQEESSGREFGARLTSQIIRLAKCLAIVMNEREVNDKVMERVTRIAMDTARGITLKAVRTIQDHQSTGLNAQSVAAFINKTEAETRRMLRFLVEIEVLEVFSKKEGGVTQAPRWRLTQTLSDLYGEVYGVES